MRRFLPGWLFAALVLSPIIGAQSTPSPGAPDSGSCERLTALTIPNITITSARNVPAGPFTPSAGGRGALNVQALCRVAIVATPTTDSRIAIEVWMPPADRWNRKFLGTDNGGFAGSIGFSQMASAVSSGYATVGTDTGHTGDQMEFGQGHPERIVDWAYRAVHIAAETAKLVIRTYYGRFPDRSYFSGCSTGGQQALSEAQRFPGDYDGVVAGDPGNNRLRLIFGFLWSWIAAHDDDGTPILAQPALTLLAKSSVEACDAQDGVRDGLIADPRQCRFDPAVLQCKGVESASCLTSRQVAAVKKIYDGATNPRTNERIYPGWARGSEQGWGTYITSPREPVRVGLFRYFVFHDPNWHWQTFDWDKDLAYVESQVPHLSAVSLDYRQFNARGGRVLMYTGLADPVVPPEDVTSYYEAVAKAAGGFVETQKFFRFFPVPGMGHCGGGSGPGTFDALGALEQWVEKGVAPSRIIASHSTAGRVDRTRPLCPFPAVARYKGTGSVDDEAHFVCAAR